MEKLSSRGSRSRKLWYIEIGVFKHKYFSSEGMKYWKLNMLRILNYGL